MKAGWESGETSLTKGLMVSDVYEGLKLFKSSFSLESYIKYRVQNCSIPDEEFLLYASTVAYSLSSIPASALFGGKGLPISVIRKLSPMFSNTGIFSERLDSILESVCNEQTDISCYRYQLLHNIRSALGYKYRSKDIHSLCRTDLSAVNSCIASLSKSLEFLGRVDCILYEKQGYICVEPYPDLSCQNINKRLDYTPFVRTNCTTATIRSVSSKFLLGLTGSYLLNHEFLWENVGRESIKSVMLLGKAINGDNLSLKTPINKIRFTAGMVPRFGVYYPSVLEKGSIDLDLSDSVPVW